jgi:hypothetical protein
MSDVVVHVIPVKSPLIRSQRWEDQGLRLAQAKVRDYLKTKGTVWLKG